MNTKKVCDKLNVSPKMLRIYEAAGLINPRRTEAGYRDYSLKDLLLIETIVRLRNLGLSVKDIKKIFISKDIEDNDINIFYIQVKAVEGKIEELTKARKGLQDTINLMLAGNERNIIELIHKMPLASESVYNNIMNSWDFDDMATDYVNRFLKDDEGYNRGISRCRELIANEACGKNIIDIGCGTCNLWESFDGNFNLTAIDNSLNMLKVAKEKVPWARLILSDARDLEEKSFEKYDYVISTFTMHHIEENMHMNVLVNMIKLCGEKGKLILIDKFFHNEQQRLQEEEKLMEQGDENQLTILRNENPLYIDELEQAVKYTGCSMDTEIIYRNIACFVIKRKS